MRLVTVPTEEGADAGGPLSLVSTAATAPEPLPEGPVHRTQGGRHRRAVRCDGAEPHSGDGRTVNRWPRSAPSSGAAGRACSAGARATSVTGSQASSTAHTWPAERSADVVERLILTVRLPTYWNSGRIAAEFGRREVWPLGHGQVDRVLARSGTHRPGYAWPPGLRQRAGCPPLALAHRSQGSVLLPRRDGPGADLPPTSVRAALILRSSEPTSAWPTASGPRRRRTDERVKRLTAV